MTAANVVSPADAPVAAGRSEGYLRAGTPVNGPSTLNGSSTAAKGNRITSATTLVQVAGLRALTARRLLFSRFTDG